MSDVKARPAIVGMAYAVPAAVRTNDDPIFDWLKKHNPDGSKLFTGYVDRRVLAAGEGLNTIMVPAASKALQAAGLEPSDVDLIVGVGSVSPYDTPNEVAQVHAELACCPRSWVVPLANDFSNFNAGLWFADGLIRAGRVRNALIVVGGNWTRHVDYHTAQSVSAADGAAAAVLASSTAKGKFEVVDVETLTDTSYYGSMYMAGTPVKVPDRKEPLFTNATFQITPAGQTGFQTFGVNEPPKAVQRLLKRHSLTGADITLMSHQASAVLLDAWGTAIKPAQYCQTLTQFANMTVANVPVNFAYFQDQIQKDHVVLLAIGAEMHTTAMLLKRG
jgi:3-oxoacyl-[acyl-carrier-protein] synthase III